MCYVEENSFFLSVLFLLSACDSGGSNPTTATAKEKAFAKIIAYVEDGNKVAPTLQDYLDVGVTGATEDNLDQLNTVVESLEGIDVDTTEELNALVTQLGFPVAIDGSATTNEDTAKAITLNATDADGDTLSYSAVTNPSHGTISISGNTATYIPTTNYNGSDSFTFTANDGTIDSNIATVTISVDAVNDAPVATNSNATTNENTAKAITLNATDTDGDTLSYSVLTNPGHGTISISGNTATYTPSANYHGTDSFTFKANDGTVDSNTATVSITVNAVNVPPNANAGVDASVTEANTIVLEGSGADVDAGDTLSYSWSPTTNLSDASIAQPTFTAPAVSTNGDLVYTLTVSDSAGATATDTVTISVLNLPAQPQNVQATVVNTQVTLTWDAVSDATGYGICQATETITNPTNCAIHQDGTLIAGATSPQVITSLINGTQYFYVVIPKNTNGDGSASAVVNATPAEPVVPSPTGLLNDTGITACGDYAYDAGGTLISGHSHSNTENCANTQDSQGDSIPAGQDGHSGRDVSQNDNSDGHAGFSFTKISNTGQALPASVSSWSCVKDNVTGLIWEVKSTSGLHNKSDRYNWYNTDNTINGGSMGYADVDGNICVGYDFNDGTTYCNTQAYVARVNTATHCGANDWRMPTREELRSIADRSTVNPAIDTTYFPNTIPNAYWSSSPNANGVNVAWIVDFYDGSDDANDKYGIGHVRLVRSGQ